MATTRNREDAASFQSGGRGHRIRFTSLLRLELKALAGSRKSTSKVVLWAFTWLFCALLPGRQAEAVRTRRQGILRCISLKALLGLGSFLFQENLNNKKEKKKKKMEVIAKYEIGVVFDIACFTMSMFSSENPATIVCMYFGVGLFSEK